MRVGQFGLFLYLLFRESFLCLLPLYFSLGDYLWFICFKLLLDCLSFEIMLRLLKVEVSALL